MRLGMMTLVVSDYDEAIAYFTCKLGFTLVEDTALSDQKRWVCVAPSVDGTRLLLAKATNDEQLARIGDQCGGGLSFFFIQLTLIEATVAWSLPGLKDRVKKLMVGSSYFSIVIGISRIL